MKEDKLYPIFISYLEHRMTSANFGQILSRSKVSLIKMSSCYFLEFKDRFDEDELFSKRILELYKCEVRNQKIDVIFDDIN